MVKLYFFCCSSQRHNVTISRVQKLLLDYPATMVVHHSEISRQTGLYTDFYKGLQLIFTFKEESANGDVGNPLLIFMANKYTISDVLVNNNVVLRFDGGFVLFIIFTFPDESEANNFRNYFRRYFKASATIPIPPLASVFLRTRRR